MPMMNREYTPPTDPLDIIYEDEQIIAVNKPSGLLSVPGRGEHLADCMISRLLNYKENIKLVHRLDCDTSGVMIFAKTPESQRHIGLQFEKRYTKKSYTAWVEGIPAELKGKVDQPIIVDWPNRPKQMICHETGRNALTNWRKVGKKNGYAKLELKPHTGRSHQLRIHCREIGHPILGDTLYSTRPELTPRLMLHATTLDLRHPIDGEWVNLVCQPPKDFGPPAQEL